MTSPNPDAAGAVAPALGRIPSGLFVVTARSGGAETGMLASWVQQCGFDPPQVSVAVNNERYILDWLAPGAAFVVNVVPDDDKRLVAHFGKGFDPGEPAFDGLELLRVGDGPPALQSAHAYLLCEVSARAPAGDHTLVIGRVTGGAVIRDAKPAVHVRKNGLKY